ncbi:MAG: phosphate uptake regulator PhoU [Candidatus Thermoplasmatota archaeon]|jgi:phosphate uptake regulator|nr:phosphate uptake regulator PhoU [Candidatus Thermoplasmatota archaeon]
MKEMRKLQITKGGTYIATLPKEWIESLGLSRGSPITLGMENGEIWISKPGQRPQVEPREIDAESFGDRKLLEIGIMASYIQGHDVTRITSGNPGNREWKTWARDALKGLVGIEIWDDSSDSIKLQNLIDPYKFDLTKMMEKFSANCASVLTDAISSLVTQNAGLASDAFDRGNELTRTYRMLMRLAMLSSKEKDLRKHFGFLSLSEVIVTVIAIREMGRIAYYAMRTAQHVPEIKGSISDAMGEKLHQMEKVTSDMQRKAFFSFMNRSLKVASQVIDTMPKVRNLYAQIHESSDFTKLASRLPMALIIRDIRAVAGYAVALADDAVLGIFS